MTLPKNVGSLDRKIRLAVASTLILAGILTGTIVLDILGLIVLATGWLGFCPAYLPFKINTIKNSES